MKKLASFFLALTLLTIFTVTSSAEALPSKAFNLAERKKGETETITICAENISNLCGVHLRIRFDSSKLEFMSQTTHVGSGACVPDSGVIDWSSLVAADGLSIKSSVALVEMSFKALDSISPTKDSITIEVVEAYDTDLKDIDFLGHCVISSGISDTPALMGDINGDGSIKSDDALMVLRASAKVISLTPAQAKLADVNGDSAIKSDDALAILRYSVGIKSEGVGVAAAS